MFHLYWGPIRVRKQSRSDVPYQNTMRMSKRALHVNHTNAQSRLRNHGHGPALPTLLKQSVRDVYERERKFQAPFQRMRLSQ